jgi:hypothetical protein
MGTKSVPSAAMYERVATRERVEMSRTGAPTTVPAARGDQAPRISGPAAALHGALGGIYGAAAMSILRLAARRAGVIDKMVPQVVEEWTLDRTGRRSSSASKTAHHVLDQFLHLGYGAAVGAACGPMLASFKTRRGLWVGAALGVGLWAGATMVLFPSLRIARPAWKSGLQENLTNVAAHLAYGLAVQLLTEEPPRQPDRRPTSDEERHAARVG